ncbi:MBL fold metallo-hydrolase [Clostridium botulinum]|uniref:MBL fold metallo-hydrolase n=1 Tax=Clostridium botulinum TaxID=1491 RepID=A0A0M1LIK5_CLOBO|nr:MBL fold metallo-hydrolase [Clostridium botulinum]KAI3349498.1 MBL fold metallo-hydrolase [Clostridium botulinum]KOM88600.1 Zn-dependent hydrolase [Clostridium botulinum]KOR57437.1 Zn-dependent hydrolase [Clostridium botulinum]MBN1048900.1 MBL fold metallo-hydrolase [Clostridium botulinum]MBN1077901.1 MBL fold metallo-hydrolase [Clostridium botulinum]
MIDIEVFPASYGESILVSLGEHNRKNILIDSGFISTYNNHIKGKLKELSSKGQAIDLFVLTHFDSDHIRGAINLLKENGKYDKPNIIKIEDIWINLLKHVYFGDNKVELSEKEKMKLKKILRKRYPVELFNRHVNDISSSESLTLSELICKGNYKNNKSFGGGLIVSNKESNVMNIDGGIKIKILSPTVDKIEELNKIWIKELLKLGLKPNFDNNGELSKAFEKLLVNIIPNINRGLLKSCSNEKDIIKSLSEKDVFSEDTDAVNGSSIAFTLEYEGKRILFLGDSHPSVIEKELKKEIDENNQKLKVDLMKVSHHGSKGNITKELLEMIDCDKFLICTNGAQYSHPDIEAISRIITTNKDKEKVIIMNYETPSIKKFLNKDLMKQYRYSIVCTNKIGLDNKNCKVTYVKV